MPNNGKRRVHVVLTARQYRFVSGETKDGLAVSVPDAIRECIDETMKARGVA